MSSVISDFPPPILEAILSHELISERRRMQKAEGRKKGTTISLVPTEYQVLAKFYLIESSQYIFKLELSLF